MYANDTGQEPLDHVVSGAGTLIRVRAIDVEREPANVLLEVDTLAADIASLRISQAPASKSIGGP